MDIKVCTFTSPKILQPFSDQCFDPFHILDNLEYLLPIIPPALLSAQNNSGSTPLHWATLNEQLDTMKALIAHPTGLKGKLVDIKNKAGRTPLGEAEMAGWDEGAAWLVGVMDLDENNAGGGGGATDEAVEENDAEGEEPLEIHVEVEDAEGGISRMTINSDGKPASAVPSDSNSKAPPVKGAETPSS